MGQNKISKADPDILSHLKYNKDDIHSEMGKKMVFLLNSVATVGYQFGKKVHLNCSYKK
jgi:hypothetical protein